MDEADRFRHRAVSALIIAMEETDMKASDALAICERIEAMSPHELHDREGSLSVYACVARRILGIVE